MRDGIITEKKTLIYLCWAGFIPLVISLFLIPWYTFELIVIVFVVVPIYFIFLLITLKYIRKDLTRHSLRMGRMTARTGLLILAIVPIAMLILSPGFGFLLTGLDYAVVALWGISCIINIITAILFKRPPEK